MDIKWYRQYLEEYVREAIANSDGSNTGIAQYLWEKKSAGRFSPHRFEKNRALDEARKAFDDHRHWPLSIILSFIGVEGKRPVEK